MDNPILSIVIANYNYGQFLETAIRSVVEQDGFDRCELIVVDGNSTDNSVDIIKKYAGSIYWWVSEKDSGQSCAFNKGFSHARGKFLTWLNSDDCFVPGALRVVVDYLEGHSGVEWVCGGSVFCNENMVVRKMRIGVWVPSWPKEWIPLHVIGGPSSFFLSERLREVGGIDERLHFQMDTDLWLRFFRNGMKLAHIGAYVWAFRVHEASKTSCMFSSGMSAAHKMENCIWERRVGRDKKKVMIGELLLKMWKLISGSYLKSWRDSRANYGRLLSEINICYYL